MKIPTVNMTPPNIAIQSIKWACHVGIFEIPLTMHSVFQFFLLNFLNIQDFKSCRTPRPTTRYRDRAINKTTLQLVFSGHWWRAGSELVASSGSDAFFFLFWFRRVFTAPVAELSFCNVRSSNWKYLTVGFKLLSTKTTGIFRFSKRVETDGRLVAQTGADVAFSD